MSNKAFLMVVGIFGCAVVLGIIGGLTTDPRSPRAVSAPMDRTQEHRMQMAEQMINRLTERFAKDISRCERVRSEECMIALAALPAVSAYVEGAARGGNPATWATAIDLVRELENKPFYSLSRR